MSVEQAPLAHAGVLRRLAAMVYDGLLLFGVLFTATLIPALVLSPGAAQTIHNEDKLYTAQPLLNGVFFRLYLVLIIILFFSWFWHRNGQTLGMQAWRLRVEQLDGQNLNGWQCLLRLLVAAVSIACLGAGYWWIWISADNRSWHDIASGSQVRLLPKRR